MICVQKWPDDIDDDDGGGGDDETSDPIDRR